MIKEKINVQKDSLVPIYTPNKEKDLLKSLMIISISALLGIGFFIFMNYVNEPSNKNSILALLVLMVMFLCSLIVVDMHNKITIKL